ncbi:hypothetical protein MTR_3g019520 [Medicago truncatula]|uniref:Uncharacterized protein n=1 Tax=Medicago truncatula TaxID=3880 RepID=G7IYY0_MEDTR|nr:hypothetical protein MTR_3g019520 [Medicago truncatula]
MSNLTGSRKTHLGWPGGIDLRSESVLLLKAEHYEDACGKQRRNTKEIKEKDCISIVLLDDIIDFYLLKIRKVW